MEEYRVCFDYSYYSVSNYGNVKNNGTDRIIKQITDKSGYFNVNLNKQIKRGVYEKVKVGVHRLVASEFIDNPDEKPEVTISIMIGRIPRD